MAMVLLTVATTATTEQHALMVVKGGPMNIVTERLECDIDWGRNISRKDGQTKGKDLSRSFISAQLFGSLTDSVNKTKE